MSPDNEFIRGPKWRTRTTAAGRRRAAIVTFALVVAVGSIVMGGTIWLLVWIGAPAWIPWSLWLVPTVAVVAWAAIAPRPAVVSDDDDEAWTTFAIQFVFVGESTARPAPVRVVSALIFGAPVIWSLTVFGLSTLVGVF